MDHEGRDPVPSRTRREPYRLTVWNQSICARGATKQLRELLELEQAQRFAGEMDFVAVPANRLGFITAEAIASPESITDEYINARIEAMALPESRYEAIRTALPELQRPPMSHQEDALAFFYRKRTVFNASEQGTGKTAVTLMLFGSEPLNRYLVVTGKSLVLQWYEEAAQTFTDFPYTMHCLVDKSVEWRREYIRELTLTNEPSMIVINYEVLYQLLPALQEYAPAGIAFDESWRLKSRTAQVTKAAQQLANRAARVHLLTGTPIGNDVGDLYSQLHTLVHNLTLMSYAEFMGEFALMVAMTTPKGTFQKPVGIKRIGRLMKMIEPMWFRVPKSACLDLPERVPNEKVILDMPQEMRTLYDRVKSEGLAALGDELNLAGERLVLLRLHQICGGFKPTYNPEEFKTTSEPILDAKLQWLLDFVRDTLVGDPVLRVIVWFKFNPGMQRCATEIAKILGDNKVATVYAATSTTELEYIKDSFNSRSEDGIQVICAQIKKLCAGHNLQGGDVNIYFTNSWSYLERSQSESRTHRAGQTRAVRYIDLVYEDSIDETVLQALERKEDLSIRLSPETV